MHSQLAIRLIVGLAQGIALYVLIQAYDRDFWPATNGYIVVPLILAVSLVPLIILQSIGNLRNRTLQIWAGGSTLIIVGLGLYDVWRNSAGTVVNTPSPSLVAALLVALFIAHALVSGGDADRKVIANYTRHFDVAWKLGGQLALSLFFIAVFWLILWLGAGLFSLIGIDAFGDIISSRVFAVPATALATAAAIHITDVRAGLVRGIRTLGLALLSWFLPLMAVIAAMFLATLPFTGLQVLWDTRFASVLLLVAALTLVVLINAAYQDGQDEHIADTLSRYFGRGAAVILVPLVALSAYALALRVAQYGWTVDRIFGAAAITIGAAYAGGYLAATVLPGPRLKLIERWNFLVACLILAIFIALFSPVADPMRIAVASQMNRLEERDVAPEDFDLVYLRQSGGRFGMTALQTLRDTPPRPGLADIREEAADMLAGSPHEAARLTRRDIARIEVRYPPGAALPAAFATAFESGDLGRGCYRDAGETCDAWLTDLNGDGALEVLLAVGISNNVYGADGNGNWDLLGSVDFQPRCTSVEETLTAGDFRVVAPEWPDIEIGGERYRFESPPGPPRTGCPG